METQPLRLAADPIAGREGVVRVEDELVEAGDVGAPRHPRRDVEQAGARLRRHRLAVEEGSQGAFQAQALTRRELAQRGEARDLGRGAGLFTKEFYYV